MMVDFRFDSISNLSSKSESFWKWQWSAYLSWATILKNKLIKKNPTWFWGSGERLFISIASIVIQKLKMPSLLARWLARRWKAAHQSTWPCHDVENGIYLTSSKNTPSALEFQIFALESSLFKCSPSRLVPRSHTTDLVSSLSSDDHSSPQRPLSFSKCASPREVSHSDPVPSSQIVLMVAVLF